MREYRWEDEVFDWDLGDPGTSPDPSADLMGGFL